MRLPLFTSSFDAEVGLHRVDVAGDVVVVRGHAQRRPCRRAGTLKPSFTLPPTLPPPTALPPTSPKYLLHAELRLVADVAHGAGERAGAEQRALRPAQHLDAADVEQVEVGREEREGDDRVVEVGADLLLDARLVAHDLAGGDAAHRHLALAGAEVLHGEAGHVRGHVLDVVDAALRAARPRWARRSEKGTSARFCSRSMAVTVTSSAAARLEREVRGRGGPPTSTSCRLWRPKPRSDDRDRVQRRGAGRRSSCRRCRTSPSAWRRVAWLVTVTVTPGMAAPVVSRTTPAMRAVRGLCRDGPRGEQRRPAPRRHRKRLRRETMRASSFRYVRPVGFAALKGPFSAFVTALSSRLRPERRALASVDLAALRPRPCSPG